MGLGLQIKGDKSIGWLGGVFGEMLRSSLRGPAFVDIIPSPSMAAPLTMAAAVLLAAAAATVIMSASASAQLVVVPDGPLPLVAPAPTGQPNCSTACGEVQVPYPFGLGPPRCSWPGFNLTCDDTRSPPRLLLGDGTLEVAAISLRNTTVRVVRRGDVANISSGLNVTFGRSFTGYTGYTLSDRNELVLSGCNVMATLLGDLDEYSNIISGCASFCSYSNTSKDEIRQSAGKYCSGLGCCQAPVTSNSRPEGVQVTWLRGGDKKQQDLLRLDPFVVVAEKGWFDQRPVADRLVGPPGQPQRPDAATLEVPLVLQWTFTNISPPDDRFPGPACPPAVAQMLCKSANGECKNNGSGDYSCQCRGGYDGNPYLDGGCQGEY